ncbi:MAG: cupin domain-containing protein [Desulfobulbaceae bacterium]|nr:cupin domain-containing protein [Desulfobulbaceae bacterium]MCK5436933.1 cupin domain-containing protein [Desulfobulbaceae bacterium]
MSTRFFNSKEMDFVDHPKFENVKIAVLVTSKETNSVSICMLDIAPDTKIPVHTHDPQVDSIFIVSGEGEAFVNGGWRKIEDGDHIFVPATEEHGIRNTGHETLRLFVHHSPPLL